MYHSPSLITQELSYNISFFLCTLGYYHQKTHFPDGYLLKKPKNCKKSSLDPHIPFQLPSHFFLLWLLNALSESFIYTWLCAFACTPSNRFFCQGDFLIAKSKSGLNLQITQRISRHSLIPFFPPASGFQFFLIFLILLLVATTF